MLGGTTSGRTRIPWLALEDHGSPVRAVAVFTAIGLAATLLGFLSQVLGYALRMRLEAGLCQTLAKDLVAVEWEVFSGLSLGRIAKAMTQDGLRAAEGVDHLLQAAGGVVVILVLYSVAFAVAPLLAGVVTLFLLLIGVNYARLGRRLTALRQEVSDHAGIVNELVVETMGHLKHHRTAGDEASFLKRMREALGAYGPSLQTVRFMTSGLTSVVEASAILFIAALLLVVASSGAVSLVRQLIAIGLFYRIAQRVQRFHGVFAIAKEQQLWTVDWLNLRAQAAGHRQRLSGTVQPTLKQALHFESVSFRYRGQAAPTIADLSFTLTPGSCLALVGPSGSGKSTVLDLILGLLPAASGAITLDGVSLEHIDLVAWRRRIGVVSQDCPVLRTSILRNIAGGAEDPDRDHAKACAKLAGAWEFIESFPGGLDAEVGERGGRLSTGQRQRLALARALYRRPWLLILDEATSALDEESENLIVESLERLKPSMAMIIVTHDASLLRLADETRRLETQGVRGGGTSSPPTGSALVMNDPSR
jgi:ATP-binding cassette subfamily C protein